MSLGIEYLTKYKETIWLLFEPPQVYISNWNWDEDGFGLIEFWEPLLHFIAMGVN